jgi:hypothetical protein
MPSLRRLTVRVCVAALGLLAVPAASAAPTPNPVAYVANGIVNALAIDGAGRTYLGGTFTQVGPRTGHGLELTATSDRPASGFPDVSGSETGIQAVASDGAGGWFIGGGFSAVGGVARSSLAHINADGSLDATWNPGVNGTVLALAVSGSDLYVGGDFSGASSIGGQDRNRIAKLSTTGTGAADATWNPNANNRVLALAVSGSDLYVGGDFSGTNSIGGQARNRIAKLSTTGTGAADATWNPNANNSVFALAVSGSDLYVGGRFSGSIGGQSRSRIAKLSTTGTGAADATWNPNANNRVFALAVSGSDLYVGGDFSGTNSIGGQDRNRIAKLSTTGTGAADASWNANANSRVSALAVSGSDLYVGGLFSGTTSIGGQDRNYIAKLAMTGTGAADASWNPNANSNVIALAVSGSDLYAGGAFTSAGGVTRNRIARLNTTGTVDTTWDPNANGQVRALLLSGSDLYVGGEFSGANSIGGQARNRIAKLSTSGTGAADATWDPNATNQVYALAVSGSDLYVGGDFNGTGSIGGQDRNYIAKLSTTGAGAADATWNPAPTSKVRALALSGSDLYVGGFFSGAGSIGGQARNRIAKLSTSGTGAADATWNPNANEHVRALALSGSDLYVGGAFSGTGSIGGQDRNYIAKLSTSGTGAADAAWNPNANGNVIALAVSGADLYAGGFFSGTGSIGGQDRNFIAKLSTTGTGAADATWDPKSNDQVRALAALGSALVVGGSFGETGSLSAQGVAIFGSLDQSAPAIAITAPADGATYTPGQAVSASYACTDPDGAGDVASCSGPVASGAAIDTSTTGAHSFTVTTTDLSGNSASMTVHYTVTAPAAGGGGSGGGGSGGGGSGGGGSGGGGSGGGGSGGNSAFSINTVAGSSKTGTVRLHLDLPGPGVVDILETAGRSTLRAQAAVFGPGPHRFAFARAHNVVATGGAIDLVITPTAAGRRALALAHRHHRKLLINVWVTYTPTGGFSRSKQRHHFHLVR